MTASTWRDCYFLGLAVACSNDETCRTCDGRCCAVFTFQDTTIIADRVARGAAYEDDLKLLEMLEPLTLVEAKKRAVKFNVNIDGMKGVHEPLLYKCCLWDEDTMLCTDYENRPRMCRTFPYGNGCHNNGCDFDVTPEYLVEEEWITPAEWFERSYA